MTGWDIRASGVASTLTETGKAADKLPGLAKTLGKHLQQASQHAGTIRSGLSSDGEVEQCVAGQPGPSGATTGPIAAALAQFVTAKKADIEYLAQRSGESMQGAADATSAYQRGDLDMAMDSQRDAMLVSDLPSDKVTVESPRNYW
ncbi:DUF6507 family protein [Streptomyces sp. NPDC048172]|uniref:DUF6507 family protein n=1 Tax=Streptomyces sp. NPDC048172 TaxID=3365505 RepID=UPI0037164C4A